MHRDDRHHVPAAALRGLERGDVAGASAFLAQRFSNEDGQSGSITAAADFLREV